MFYVYYILIKLEKIKTYEREISVQMVLLVIWSVSFFTN